MSKQKTGITLKNIPPYQLTVGKSLIHRCCGTGMTKVTNLDSKLGGKSYFVCSQNCGQTEIPYLSQILNANPDDFYNGAKLESILQLP